MTDLSVQWLYAAEHETGGIAAWNDDGHWHKAYMEVSGYLLPTMLKWGADDLAVRCAGWLVNKQNPDGSWNGLDDTPRPFDTSAIIEGLRVVYDKFQIPRVLRALARAERWMNSLITADGYLPNSHDHPGAEIYNLRASAIIANRRELDYWQTHGLNHKEQRAHYMAYALEGALNLDPMNAWARNEIVTAYHTQTGLIPFYVRPDWTANHSSVDYCASAQMGILYHRIGLDASKIYRLLKGVVEPNGGIPQADGDGRQISWAVKFYLDLKGLMNE